ncbi:MAG TPA: Ku protein [Polyangiaceae bacterium]
MAARAIASGTISFGLVSIPCKLFTAASSEQVSFNMLHKKCGGRVKMQYICPTDNEVVERADTIKGYEHSRGQYVLFSEEELKAFEAERSNAIEITEFVPLASVDFVHVEKSYYLGSDKGGDKAYVLLAQAMTAKKMVAVGRWAARGKEQLVIVRPHQDGLILHQLFYANEVRAWSEIDGAAKVTISDKERELAEKLIDQLSSDAFEADKYHDTYSDKVLAAVEQKAQGQEITVAPEAPKAQIIDLFDALKRTLATAPAPPPSVLKPPAKAKTAEEEPAAPKKRRAK